jgi:hypothetical protein
MATTNQHTQAPVGTVGQEVPHPAPGDGGQLMAARLTTEQVWHQVAKASFAVIGYVAPARELRSSGVVYRASAGGCMWPSQPTAGRPGTSRPPGGSR